MTGFVRVVGCRFPNYLLVSPGMHADDCCLTQSSILKLPRKILQADVLVVAIDG